MANTILNIGTVYVGTIDGATNGSVITAVNLPSGFTINSSARTWRYDGTGVSTNTNITLVESLTGATNNPRNTILTLQILVPAPNTAIPTFTVLPSFDSGTNRMVGDVFTYSPGTVKDGTLNTVSLYRNDALVGLLSGGSGTFDAAGDYKIVSSVQNSDVTGVSAIITVAMPTLAPITPPSFRFANNRVSGTNPPEIFWDDIDDTVLATDDLVVTWYTNGVKNVTTIDMSIDARTGREFVIPAWANLAAGTFSVSGHYERTSDVDGNVIAKVSSLEGPTLSDTLGAKMLPPATTVWSNNKSRYAYIDETDPTRAYGYGTGGPTPILVTNARSDMRFAELKVITNSTSRFRVGIAPADTIIDPNAFSVPSGSVSLPQNYNTLQVGDVFTLLMTPTQLTVFKNNVLADTYAHTMSSYKIFCSIEGNDLIELNTGQRAFVYPPTDPAYIRYN